MQRKRNLRVRRLVANSRLVGMRGDGQSVDDTYCANGKWRGETGDSHGTAHYSGKRWWITNARFHRRNFTAILRGNGGYSIALARRNGHWKYGIDDFGRVTQLGPVTRSNATQECRTL